MNKERSSPDRTFSDESLAFLRDLKKNNSRDWFQSHKEDYERFIKSRAQFFAEEISKRLEKLTNLAFTGKVFRIHRDVRFSKDKTPYNCHVHISFFPSSGKKATEGGPAFHFALETDSVTVGVGCFEFPKDTLTLYRNYVADSDQGKQLASMVLSLCTDEQAYLEEPELKRVPKGYAPDHPRQEFLRRKGLALWHKAPLKDHLHTSASLDVVTSHFSRLMPVFEWIYSLEKENSLCPTT